MYSVDPACPIVREHDVFNSRNSRETSDKLLTAASYPSSCLFASVCGPSDGKRGGPTFSGRPEGHCDPDRPLQDGDSANMPEYQGASHKTPGHINSVSNC
ncbi:hypothetical protein DPEC_G00331180 [Dallia pectoralis]|uniref:Uncharacterized protein n=1 Tax=Dallia pectoralis TaxID=75939 RepID=A0ACC2F950_DALPE|nr:hypothetical protein DPEC_G00331180 [Dallia pectoralis]